MMISCRLLINQAQKEELSHSAAGIHQESDPAELSDALGGLYATDPGHLSPRRCDQSVLGVEHDVRGRDGPCGYGTRGRPVT